MNTINLHCKSSGYHPLLLTSHYDHIFLKKRVILFPRKLYITAFMIH